MKPRAPRSDALRKRAIDEYHDLLAADETLSAELLAKLRSAMRTDRLLYGDRPIGVSLRPHLLDSAQFQVLTQSAQSIASALEKIATAALQSPELMRQLGLTDMERKLALVDPGFSFAAATTRIDGLYTRTNCFVEYNAEIISLSDQEGLNRILFELPAMAAFTERYRLRQFSAVAQLLETLIVIYREWSGGRDAPNVAILDWGKSAHLK